MDSSNLTAPATATATVELSAAQRQRIDNGAWLLDWKHPTWAWWINPETLDIDGFTTCVLAQLFKSDYRTGLVRLGLGDSTEGDERAAEYGFYPHKDDLPGYMDKFSEEAFKYAEALIQSKNAYWKELVRQRQIVIKGEAP